QLAYSSKLNDKRRNTGGGIRRVVVIGSRIHRRPRDLTHTGIDKEVVTLHQSSRPRLGKPDKTREGYVLEIVSLDEHAGVLRRSHAVFGVAPVIVVEDMDRMPETNSGMAAARAIEEVVVIGHSQVADVRRKSVAV